MCVHIYIYIYMYSWGATTGSTWWPGTRRRAPWIINDISFSDKDIILNHKDILKLSRYFLESWWYFFKLQRSSRTATPRWRGPQCVTAMGRTRSRTSPAGARKGANGVGTNGVTSHFMLFDRGTFRVLPLTYFYQSVKTHYFCSGPISVDRTSSAAKVRLLLRPRRGPALLRPGRGWPWREVYAGGEQTNTNK